MKIPSFQEFFVLYYTLNSQLKAKFAFALLLVSVNLFVVLHGHLKNIFLTNFLPSTGKI